MPTQDPPFRDASARCALPLFVLLVAFLALGGCEQPREEGNDQATSFPEVAVLDSFGARIVSLPREIEAYAAPKLDLEPLTRIGEQGSEVDLFGVSGARFLPSGVLVIANAGVPELLLVTEGGRLLARMGQRGEGPGEFGTISSLHIQEDGTILTYDHRQVRLTEWNPDEGAGRTRRLAEPNPIVDLIPLVASMDGPALAVLGDNRVFGQNGTRQDSTPFFRFTPESTHPDTLSLWATKTWSFVALGNAVARTQVPFSPDLLFAGNGRWAALANTHEPAISVFGEDGSIAWSVRWEEEGREVTEEEFREWQEERLAAFLQHLPEGKARERLDIPYHPNHPVLEAIFLDRSGELWFAPTSLLSERRRTWIRLDGQGRPLGGVELPASARILDASRGRLAVLDRDQLDVEVITVYGFEELAGEG